MCGCHDYRNTPRKTRWAAIAEYAARKKHEDRSHLYGEGRAAFATHKRWLERSLKRRCCSGTPTFETVLVYDVEPLADAFRTAMKSAPLTSSSARRPAVKVGVCAEKK